MIEILLTEHLDAIQADHRTADRGPDGTTIGQTPVMHRQRIRPVQRLDNKRARLDHRRALATGEMLGAEGGDRFGEGR